MTTNLTPALPAKIQTDRDPESPFYGTVSVDAGYYGLVVRDRIAWAVSITDRPTAERIVANQDAISEVVARNGGRARVKVEFDGDTMTVSDYDWRRWSETVPAR